MKQNSIKKNDKNHFYYAFTCDRRMDYYPHIYENTHVKNGSVDTVFYGVHDRRGGAVCEMRMTWYLLGGKECPRLEVFSDHFDEFTNAWHIELMKQIQLLEKKEFTAEEFSRILIALGFEDESDIKLEEIKNV